jgi:hypothetical protein
MPKVNKRVARKDYPEFGILKGEEYYNWAFNYGPKFKSKTPPTRSQLTQSSFLKNLYDIQDGLDKRFKDTTYDSFDSDLQELVDDITSLKDECENSLDNIPEQLREAPAGSTLQERIDALEEWISELEGVQIEELDEENPDNKQDEALTNAIEEALSTTCNL